MTWGVYATVAPGQVRGHIGGMSRIPIAVLVFLAGFTAYIAAAVVLADHVLKLHWTVQAVYFLVAGTVWAWPTRALMVWAARGQARTR